MSGQMRGVQLLSVGSPENLEFRKDLPKPSPKAFEVLVRVRACCVTDADKQIVQGKMLAQFVSLPTILGVDIVGTVEEIGIEVTEFKIGDEIVCILPAESSGGFAEYVVVNHHLLVKRPSLVSEDDAVCVLSPGLRAYTALHYKMKLCAGETVLILNGATTFGCIAIQLALQWGAKVITTATSSLEFNYLQGLSTQIDRVIDLTSEKLVTAIMEETNSMGVDCIIHTDVIRFPTDASSNISSLFDLSMIQKRDIIKCLAPHGHWITSSEIQLDPPESRLLLLKGASISFLFDQLWLLAPTQQGRMLHVLNDILDKVSRGLVKPKIAQVYPLERARQALKDADNQIGSIILKS